MLLVIASQRDQFARQLVERWKDHNARLMTCRDLSTSGWRYYPDNPRASRAVIDGQRVSFDEISGVLTCIPSVIADELDSIAPADRSYVAAEMTSFLTAWLSQVSCPVINRPTPTSLIGPCWYQQQWVYQAAEAGMRIHESARSADPQTGASVAPTTFVVVVGSSCVGRVADRLALQSRRLAEAAGVELLTVAFSSPDEDGEFIRAYLGADVSQPDVADALLNCFQNCAALS